VSHKNVHKFGPQLPCFWVDLNFKLLYKILL